MSAAISVRQLAVTFPGSFRKPAVVALQPFDLEVEPGAIVGILGPNGSGKTTLLRVLAGLQRPTSGTAQVLGAAPGARALRQRLAYQPEGPLPLGALTGREFLQWYGCELGLPNHRADERTAALLKRFELTAAGERLVRTYSTGMQKRLALAAALLGEPEVLLLDEPTSGLDPLGSGIVLDILRECAQRGTAILMASHHLQEIEQSCSSIVVLQNGRCELRGTLDELLGTTDRTITIRGLTDEALRDLEANIEQRGGQVVAKGHAREHLFALFRRLNGAPRP